VAVGRRATVEAHDDLRKVPVGLDLHVDALLRARHGWRTRWPLHDALEVVVVVATAVAGARPASLVNVTAGAKLTVVLHYGLNLGFRSVQRLRVWSGD
jgi:hypothetical protein